MFQDTDNTDKVRKVIRGVHGTHAIAGIFSPDKAHLAERLSWQEFGTTQPGSVQRQTVAPAFDKGEAAVVRALAEDLSDALDGTLPAAEVPERMAITLAANIRERIESNTPPELAESTKAARRRRGNTSTQTLVDSGDMLGAIEHKVTGGGKVDTDG